MNSWIFPVLTILMSGVVSATLAHKLAAKKEKRLLMRNNAAELYISAHRYCRMMNIHHENALTYFKGKIPGSALLKMSNDNRDEGKAYDKTLLQVNMYFPQVRPFLDKVFSYRALLSSMSGKGFNIASADDKNIVVKEMESALAGLQTAETEFLSAILAEADKFK